MLTGLLKLVKTTFFFRKKKKPFKHTYARMEEISIDHCETIGTDFLTL